MYKNYLNTTHIKINRRSMQASGNQIRLIGTTIRFSIIKAGKICALWLPVYRAFADFGHKKTLGALPSKPGFII
ncbi:MAG: hypothetical protein EA364_08735 [Balneolaceae bacterium]|jgi:hypothetical protein|nr:MAG: hypothetical protein EA364_08735 [Balneolaceae bacterium]